MSDRGQSEATAERRAYWQRRLGRIRLGAESVEDQLARYRRVTWVLTAMALGISAIIVAIFIAFGAPLIGLGVVCVLFLPMVALAWWDYRRMAARVREYRAASHRSAG